MPHPAPPRSWPGVIDAYRPHLPVAPETPAVTLLEGGTPLLDARTLAREIAGDGGLRLWLKLEGLNPTGSFKDRGMTVAITRAVESGARAVICASTGNTSASAAAYAARAGLRCVVLLPHGMTALGKLSQAIVHGAVVVPIEGNFDDALSLVREISQTRPVTLVNSLNPDRIEGQKTVAFEICDTLGDAPDFHAMPVGNAGNITAAWRGYREYHSLGHISRLPRLLGFQAAGAAPLATGRPFPEPETIATAIRIGRPASGAQALAARDESGGRIEAVTDEEIMAAYRLIARSEGIFCEPASAASVAGVIRAWAEGYFDTYPLTRRTVVCTLTGHGLKDPDAAMRELPALRPVPARMDRVLEAIELE